MRLHEVLEQAAAALFIFRDVLLQCRDRHGADVTDCEHRRELDAQGEAFDEAVEFASEQERGLQCRVQEIMLLDRNENGLETHGDLLAISHSCVRRRPCSEVGKAFGRLAVSRTTPAAGYRHPGRSLLSCQQPGKLDREQPDYRTSEAPFCCSASFTGLGEAGNCSTVACWPSHSRVSSTVSPSGNSSASWCTLGLSALICRNRATFPPSLMCARKAKKRS